MITKSLSVPIVAVMGHIDHGKSTLLDYIRNTKVAINEVGGITQHLSAYKIEVPYQENMRSITFLDTPGHAAFAGMRERGAVVADIAILVVSAEDGVKAQTIEALNTIRESNVPFVVAINKIDKPEANIERVKQTLAEHEVLVEGYGGTTAWVAISAINGTGVADLLETILLVADIENMTSDPQAPVTGLVIESGLDPRRGISATVIIKSGTLRQGQFVVAKNAITTTRIMENFLKKSIKEATPGTPVHLVGFNQAPTAGTEIKVFDKKKDAEKYIESLDREVSNEVSAINREDRVVPIIIKADAFGTTEAVAFEISKLKVEGLYIKIINKGVGAISENDIVMAQSDKDVIILGFNVGLDSRAQALNESVGATVETFNIIYKLTEWLSEELEKRRPRIETRFVTGKSKVLKTFSKTKDRQVLGAKMQEGTITAGSKLSIIRRDYPIATAVVVEMQQAKQKTKEVTDGEFGMLVESKHDIAPGDVLEAFVMKTV